MRLDRRTFLQQAALALVSVGVSETGINLLSKNSRFAKWLKPYVETLAQTTNRKLALLVGINEYNEKAHLRGCLNDVELQKELLVHRFGFKPQDIYTLTNRQATRENIETAFLEHLSQQANSNDLVLFHFSGYGSQVKTSDDRLVNSLVPIDGIISTKGDPAANELLQNTLAYLARSLKTEQLVTILDTSFQNTPEILQGNYRIRSYSQLANRPSTEEVAFQEHLQRTLAGKGVANYLKTATIPGILLSAAEQNQLALEGTWDNFSAGLLTYALTRYLWQTTPKTNIQVALQHSVNSVSRLSEKQQQPKLTGRIKSDLTVNAFTPLPSGEGFITDVDSKGLFNLQLTALPFTLLDTYQDESCFTIANSEEQNLLQLRSREGIFAKAQLTGNGKITNKDAFLNQVIQEAIRVLPRNLGLNVALDNHLERIEKVDATSAMANISCIKASATAGDAYADCLLGKIAVMVEKQAKHDPQAAENPSHSYGLYTPRGTLIPNTPGEANEVVKLAVNRLKPYFEKLLAAKWLELIVNENSSTLPVTVTLDLDSQGSAFLKKTTLRTAIEPELSQEIPNLERSSEIRLRINNQSDRDLYGIIIGVDSEGKAIALYNPQKSATNTKTVIPDNLKVAAKNQLIIPQTKTSWHWKIAQPPGIAKVYLILAIKPFAQTLELIARQPINKSEDRPIVNLLNPLEVSQAVLEDLHQSSNVDSEIISANSDVYALDVDKWVGFKFTALVNV